MKAAQIKTLNNRQLLERSKFLAQKERSMQAALIAHLVEVDRRRLYLPRFTSLFCYVVDGVKLSPSSAKKRGQVIRLARNYPEVIGWINRSEITLTNLSLCAPHVSNLTRGDSAGLRKQKA